MPREPDCEVGYKKPPTHSQFKKGQSGNPRGRPRGSKNFNTRLREAADEKVLIIENGKRRKVALDEVAIKRFVRQCAQGDYRSTRDLFGYLQEDDRQREQERTRERSSPPRRHSIVVLPDNGRDPELTAVLRQAEMEAQAKYFARKRREREGQNPANENTEEVPDKHSSAA
jgi:hypothetical protein